MTNAIANHDVQNLFHGGFRVTGDNIRGHGFRNLRVAWGRAIAWQRDSDIPFRQNTGNGASRVGDDNRANMVFGKHGGRLTDGRLGLYRQNKVTL
jgi:hypothetical protein